MIMRVLVVLVLVAGFAYWRLADFALPAEPGRAEPAAQTGGADPEPAAAPRNTPALGSFAAIAARPLFREDRRPPAAAVPTAVPAPQAEAPEPAPDWRLVGIGRNEIGLVALLRVPGQVEPVRARVGDIVEGRHVTGLTANSISLRIGTGDETVTLLLDPE